MSIKTSNGVTVNLLGDINLAKAKGVRSFVEKHWTPADSGASRKEKLIDHNYRQKSTVLAEYLENMLTLGLYQAIEATYRNEYEFEFDGSIYSDGLVMLYCVLFESRPGTNEKLSSLKVQIATIRGKVFRHNYKAMSNKFSVIRLQLLELGHVVSDEDLKSYVITMGRSLAVKEMADRTDRLEEQEMDARAKGDPGDTWTHINEQLRLKQTTLESRGAYAVGANVEKLIKSYLTTSDEVEKGEVNKATVDKSPNVNGKGKGKNDGDISKLKRGTCELYKALPKWKQD